MELRPLPPLLPCSRVVAWSRKAPTNWMRPWERDTFWIDFLPLNRDEDECRRSDPRPAEGEGKSPKVSFHGITRPPLNGCEGRMSTRAYQCRPPIGHYKTELRA
jgi:hypothetical protein